MRLFIFINLIMANKNNTKTKPEVLAPVGTLEAFYGVLRAGADAVYLAGNKFGARAYADNFSTDTLVECIKYAHLYGRKVYLTVNTLTRSSEFDELYNFLCPVYEAGLDGVIIQDLGVLKMIERYFPELERHASTQMNITTSDGAMLLKNEGVSRIVPARELSISELKNIKKDTGLELECFVHGAICYCYSGQCLFSSVLGGRSGNRGRCAQPCRLPYISEFSADKEQYPLSLKDMCTAYYLPKLIEAGIDSFKIEGRMKKPEYAAGITALYRKYVDQYFETGRVDVSKYDRRVLSTLYIRSEVSEGYYERHNGADMITLNSPSYNGTQDDILSKIREDYLGEKPIKELEKYKIEFSASFITNEPACLTVSINDIYITVYGNVVTKAIKRPISAEDVAKQLLKLGNTVFSCEENELRDNIYISDDAYYDLKGINSLRREAVLKLSNAIIESFGLPTERKVAINDKFEFPIADIKINGINKADINKAGINKTDINKASRYKEAQNEIAKNLITHNSYIQATDVLKNRFNIAISSMKQLAQVIDFIDRYNIITTIYVPEELVVGDSWSKYNGRAVDVINSTSSLLYIAMPYVRRNRDKKIIDRIKNIVLSEDNIFKGVLVRNIEDLHFVNEINSIISEKENSLGFESLKIATDYGIYCWNDYALDYLAAKAVSIGLPLELSGAETKALTKKYNGYYSFEKMVYGRIPLMHTANCIRKTYGKCLQMNKQELNTNASSKAVPEVCFTSLVDRTNRSLPVAIDCAHCQNTVYNAVKLSLSKGLDRYDSNVFFRIDFTDETTEEISKVLKAYLINEGEITWEKTSGFEKQGTE